MMTATYVWYKLRTRDMYKEIIHQFLQDCEGVHNILDDVLVHAATEEENYQRFENVVTVLSSKGLTLNSNKCQLKISPLESAGGISPSDVTVKAVVELSDTKNATEVRNFLALANFTAHFIPVHCQHP